MQTIALFKNQNNLDMSDKNIKTLRSMFFNYPHEQDTKQDYDYLEKLQAIIHDRRNCMEKLVRIGVPQKDVVIECPFSLLCRHHDQSAE